MFGSVVVPASEIAILAKEYERARVLLALALREEMRLENKRLAQFIASATISTATPLLTPIVQQWEAHAPPAQREPTIGRWRDRRFAFADAPPSGGAGDPFPAWAAPQPADVDATLEGSFFNTDAQRARDADAAGTGLLPTAAAGRSTCDLLAACVQLVLSGPFAPYGSCGEMLLGLLDALAAALGATSVEAPPPVAWDAVAALPPAALLAAMRGVDDDLFYEASDDAIDAWCSSRASRLSRLFAALRDRAGGGGVTLAWLRDEAPWAALRALVALPGVQLHHAASLLLYELRMPFVPVCRNALEELKALKWVPPYASAEGAFLHINSRRAGDSATCRALYTALTRANVFRISRRAVVGADADGDADGGGARGGGGDWGMLRPELRERRGVLAMQLSVRRAEGGGDGLVVGGGADDADLAAPLEDVVTEALAWHQLYGECGCTPAFVCLRPLDAASARTALAAHAARRLPRQQQEPGDGELSYSIDVQWGAAEVLALALVLTEDGAAAAEEGDDDRLVEVATDGVAHLEVDRLLPPPRPTDGGFRFPALLRALGGDGGGDASEGLRQLLSTAGGGGRELAGFGPHAECAAHLAAKTNRAAALSQLVGDAAAAMPLDSRGRTPLHAAAQAGALRAVETLLKLRCDPAAADREGRTALVLAAAAEKPKAIAMLLAAAPSLVSAADRQGIHPLEAAAEAGAIHSARALLTHGANVDAASKRGRTALHAAARAGHLALARVLVDAGASLLLKDLTERRADEMIPPERAADGAWLVEATKAARGKPID